MLLRVQVAREPLRRSVHGRGHSGRPAADNENIDVEGLALDSGKFLLEGFLKTPRLVLPPVATVEISGMFMTRVLGLYDHLVRVLDNIDLYREMLSSALDANLSVTSNNLNVIVKRLTAFTVILMIPTLIAGIYGLIVVLPLYFISGVFVPVEQIGRILGDEADRAREPVAAVQSRRGPAHDFHGLENVVDPEYQIDDRARALRRELR